MNYCISRIDSFLLTMISTEKNQFFHQFVNKLNWLVLADSLRGKFNWVMIPFNKIVNETSVWPNDNVRFYFIFTLAKHELYCWRACLLLRSKTGLEDLHLPCLTRRKHFSSTSISILSLHKWLTPLWKMEFIIIETISVIEPLDNSNNVGIGHFIVNHIVNYVSLCLFRDWIAITFSRKSL